MMLNTAMTNELIENVPVSVIPTAADLEVALLDLPQAECPVYHRFEPGHYIREVHMPAGAVAVGHYQNFEHINVFVSGRVLMLNDDGTTQELAAPMTFIGRPGRKVGLILEDVVWQNVYPTNETDVELLEATYLTKSDYWLQNAAHQFALESTAREVDRRDYERVIQELGYTQDQVDAMVYNTEDQTTITLAGVAVQISPIHGQGIFATANFKAGDVIGPAGINGLRTQLGRYTNHSSRPNAVMVAEGSDVFLVATEDITGAVGGQSGQEITIDYGVTRKQIEGR